MSAIESIETFNDEVCQNPEFQDLMDLLKAATKADLVIFKDPQGSLHYEPGNHKFPFAFLPAIEEMISHNLTLGNFDDQLIKDSFLTKRMVHNGELFLICSEKGAVAEAEDIVHQIIKLWIKRSNNKLKKLEKDQNLQNYINSSDEIIYILDTDMTIRMFNRTANDYVQMLFGASLSEGLDFSLLLPKSRKELFTNRFRKALAGARYKYDFFYDFKNLRRWVGTNMIPLKNQYNQVEGVVLILEDINEKIEKQQENEALITKLSAQNHDLKRFSYIISHDLRSPVVNLVGALELFDLNAGDNERNRALIEVMKTTCAKMSGTLEDLLEVLLSKDRVRTKTKLSINHVLNDVIGVMRYTLEEALVTFHSDFSAAPEVYYIEEYLFSIFQNLISNSVKYAHEDRNPVITIRTFLENQRVIIEYSDNGRGLDVEKYKDRIFGLHQRFHKHSDSKGLGLYLIHSQIMATGGEITVEGQENKGLKFRIKL